MKRGRPNLRDVIKPLILEILSDSVPRSVNSIKKDISKKLYKEISWNTIQKYLQELIEIGKVEALAMPHSKKEGKEGLTVYILKK